MRILIAIDYGTCSKNIIRFFSDGKFSSSTKVMCVHVIEPSAWQSPGFYPVIAPYPDSILETHRQAASELLFNMYGILKDAYFDDVDFRVLEGNIVEEINNAATEFGADLIVMAKQNKGFVEKLIFGSVTQRVIENTSCSVAVVKEAQSPVTLIAA